MAQPHQRVVVVVLLVDPVTPLVEPEPLAPEPPLPIVPPEVEPVPPVPLAPIELVPPLPLEPLLLVVESVLPLVPLVLGVEPAVLLLEPVPLVDGVVGGVVVLDELVEPVLPVAPVPVVASFLLQALSESAATTARVAAAHCVRDVFIRKLLEGLFEIASRKGQPSPP